MSEGKGLPRGWCWAKLGDLTTNCLNGFGKRHQEDGTPTIVLRLADIEKGEVSLVDARRVKSTPAEVDKYQLVPDDLVAIRVNGSPALVGRLVRFIAADEPVLFCDHFIRVRLPDPTMARFVRLYADTEVARAHMDENKVSSAGQNTISQRTLEGLYIPLPPANEQGRIVAKVEELLSDLDAGVAALKRARANLKRYRAAVLRAAVAGALTEEWRTAHPAVEPATKLLERILPERRRKWEADQQAKFAASGKALPKNWQEKYVEPAQPDTTTLPLLPPSWCWASMEQAIEIIDYRGRTPPYSDEGIPHLRSFNVKQGKITWDGITHVTETTYQEYMTRGLPESGDLLFTTEAPLGEVALAPTDTRFSMAQRLLLLRPLARLLDSKYLMYQLMASDFQASLSFRQTGSTVTGVSSRNLKPLPIRIPPLSEQRAIAEEVEQQLSVIAAADDYFAASLKRAGRLRQSILKEAFSGRLVPQDPTDEPASVLLERIKQERAAVPAQPNGQARTRKQRTT